MTNYFNAVSKSMEQLGRRHELSNVFNDLLTMAICSYHRTNIQNRLAVKDPDNEKIYMNIVSKYSNAEVKIFPEIIGHLMLNASENPYSDILGEYFMQHITHGQNGQYFTPEPICKMLALLQVKDDKISGIKVADPACGSGRLLLQFADLHPDNYFYGADNNNTCAKMAVLNFFLNGLRSEVAWMNSLSMEWHGGWQVNMDGLGVVPIEKEQSLIWKQPPKPEQKSQAGLKNFSSDERGTSIQLSLF